MKYLILKHESTGKKVYLNVRQLVAIEEIDDNCTALLFTSIPRCIYVKENIQKVKDIVGIIYIGVVEGSRDCDFIIDEDFYKDDEQIEF